MLGEELRVLDDQPLELLDLVTFEDNRRGHDTILLRARTVGSSKVSHSSGSLQRRLIRMRGDEDRADDRLPRFSDGVDAAAAVDGKSAAHRCLENHETVFHSAHTDRYQPRTRGRRLLERPRESAVACLGAAGSRYTAICREGDFRITRSGGRFERTTCR